SRSAAVRLARPYLPGGSFAVPLNDTRFTWATGTLCSSTTHTGSPFDSVCFWIAGSFSAAGGPGCGGFVRSGCCAKSATDGTSRTTRTKTCFLICIQRTTATSRACRERARPSTGSGRASRRIGPGGHIGPPLRLFLWFDRQLHAPVERQKLRRCGADVASRERAIACEIFVEVVGIARVGEVRVQLVAFAAEAADALHAVVKRRLDLIHRPLEL